MISVALGSSEQMRMTIDSSPDGTRRDSSLCHSCSFMREVAGRHGQRYLLCRNPALDAKYPRQPVLTCAGYSPSPPLQNP